MGPADGERERERESERENHIRIAERGLKVTCYPFVIKYLVLFKIRSKSRRLEVTSLCSA